MARGGYYHGDKYIGPSSKHKYAKKTVHNSGTYNKSRNNKSSYTTYKPKTTKKSTYKPDYSKTYHQSGYSRTYHKPSHPKSKPYRKRQSYNVISVEEANRRSNQNKKSKSNSSSVEDIGLMALFCMCGILAFTISFAMDNPIVFFLIFIGLMVVVLIFWGIIEKITKRIKSYKNNRPKKINNSDGIIEWKICPDCSHQLVKVQKKCPYCKHEFE